MPDWFYRTVSRPLLFRLSAPRARDLALGFMGTLARLPLGGAVIDFLGHMRADPRLRQTLLGIDFPSPVGLGPGVDTRARAVRALARFGCGFLEVGPVTRAGNASARSVERLIDRDALWFADPPDSLSLAAVESRLRAAPGVGIPLMVRLRCAEGAGPEVAAEECTQLIQALGPHVSLFSLALLPTALARDWSPEQWAACLRSLAEAARSFSPPRPLLLCLPADLDLSRAAPLIEAALAAGVGGLLVDGSIAGTPDGRVLGPPAREPALEQVRQVRRRWGKELPLIASGGVHEPEDALALRDAGANLVQVESGLVYSGPGLPKRINEAFLYSFTREQPPAAAPERPAEMTWFWATLMGAGMLLGSLMALVIAAARVVLPYDEAAVGMSREELLAVNPRLLDFMAHDRVTLAGTMIAIGVMYLGLSLFGIRRGLHWARQAVLMSAFVGFASFFLFLGFGYLDTFHAFVTAALLQLLLLAVHCRLGIYRPDVPPRLRGDGAWRRGLWGQLLLIVHGFALLAAGVAICFIGATSVFVPEDLHFMQTTAEHLRAANPRLVPLIAHDRATFGGMLLASAGVFLLPALWGFREGSAWLWWSWLIAGLSAYAAAIGVHFAVGYTDLKHLLPAFAGLGLFLLGLALSYRFLCGKGP